jgi:hypothetical protein
MSNNAISYIRYRIYDMVYDIQHRTYDIVCPDIRYRRWHTISYVARIQMIHTHTSVYIHMTTLQVFLILLLFVSVLNWGGQFTPTGHMSKGLCTWVLLTVNIFWKCRWIGCYCLFRRGEYCMTDNFSIERAVAFNTQYPCNIIMCRSLCNVVVLLLFIFVLSNLMWSIIWS